VGVGIAPWSENQSAAKMVVAAKIISIAAKAMAYHGSVIENIISAIKKMKYNGISVIIEMSAIMSMA